MDEAPLQNCAVPQHTWKPFDAFLYRAETNETFQAAEWIFRFFLVFSTGNLGDLSDWNDIDDSSDLGGSGDLSDLGGLGDLSFRWP